ncbi:MAG: glycosyltransferase family 9 protein [Kiritimatiellia bacterium]|nr:glycosyltransferase family 9 protein [Kiritimatiellia bacterium]
MRTPCPHIWENNPHITSLDDDEAEVIDCEYPLIHQSNTSAYHFIHGFVQHVERELKLRIPVTEFKGDIHLSDLERSWMSQVEEMGVENRFWIIVAGGKLDFTAKWWNPDSYQEVVDHFRGKITFVQVGEDHHFHPRLQRVIDLVGKTDLRQFIRLVYHSVGVLAPISFPMHAAAAVPVRHCPPKNRGAVIIAGGREPPQWEAYPHHRFLCTNGALECCDNGGCWKSRCTLVGDGDPKDTEDLCLMPATVRTKTPLPRDKFTGPFKIAKCMQMITAEQVIRAIEQYYEGGVLKYDENGRKGSQK